MIINKHQFGPVLNLMLAQRLMMTVLLIFFTSVTTAEEDMWADLDEDNASASEQQAEAKQEYAEPPIQMWAINKPNDMFRVRPAPGTFRDFTQGSIDFWVKHNTGWDDRDESGTIVALSNGYDTVFEFSMSAEGDAIFMANAEDDVINGERSRVNAVNFDFTDGLIHHVAVVTEDNHTKMHVDGKFVGEFSIGYSIPYDAKGQKQNLQLSIGSLDGRKNKFKGEIGGLRIWGVPLEPSLLLKAAFLRDNALLNQNWAKSFLIAHLDNLNGQEVKPKLNVLGTNFNRADGIWMQPNDITRTFKKSTSFAKTFKSTEGVPLDYEYNPQTYSQFLLASRNSELGRFSGATQVKTKTLTQVTVNQNTNTNSNKRPQVKTRPQSSYAPIGFTKKANTTIHGQKLAIKRVGIEQCAQMCRDNSECLAFTFEPKKFDCSITANTSMVVNNPERDSYFITRNVDNQPSADSVASSEVSGYTKMPGKFVLGSLVKVIKSDLAQCASACSNENKCIEFSYNAGTTQCFLVSNRNKLATVSNTNTYTKISDTAQNAIATQPADTIVSESQEFKSQQPIAPATLKSPIAVQAPTQPITNQDLPVLVELVFDPNQPVAKQVTANVFEPAGRNRYQSSKGLYIQVTSATRMNLTGKSYSRVSSHVQPKKTDANVDDVFIVGNQIRNKDRVLVGYDPLKLDPFTLGGSDGGLKKQIFKHSQYGFKNGANRVVPIGLDLVDIQSGEGRTKSQEASSQATLQEMLGGSVSASIDVNTPKGGGSFSANANFKSTTSSLQKKKTGFTFAQTHQTRFIVLVDKANVGLTSDFREAVINASENPTAQSAMQLVLEFGTHYSHAVAMGGRIIQMLEFTEDEWAQGQTYEGGLGVAVEARIGPKEAGGKVGAAANAEASQTQGFESKTSVSDDKWMYIGGQGTGLQGWSVQDDSVTPIFLDLRALSELLAPPFFNNPKVFNTLRPLVHQAIKQYVNENKGPIETEGFKPKALKLDVAKFVDKKACKFDKWTWRAANNTDSKLEGGGVWVRFALPAKDHAQSVSFKAGCFAGSHFDGPIDAMLECNRVCWSAAQFTCNDGKWEHSFKKKPSQVFSSDLLCHSTGETSQDHLQTETGNAPWVFPPNMCEMLPPEVPGRPKNCNDDF
jgi:MAC/Perforin domain/Concanavalin A-like lectin/glucanases superfamily/PAN domain